MGKRLQEGFTLIELLVLMMVLALVLGLGVPAMSDMVANNEMARATNDLVSSIRTARAHASMMDRPVTVCASRDWDSARPHCSSSARLLDGWIVFEDIDGNAAVGASEQILQAHGPISDSIRTQGLTISDGGTPQFLSFRNDGVPVSVGGKTGIRHIQLCDHRGDRHTGAGRAAGRLISIGPAGNTHLTSNRNRLQDAANPLGGC